MNINRDLKFRAWNKDLKKMYYFDLVDLKHIKDREELCCLELTMKIMQYTGIQDVLGHDIYEGDIISIKHENEVECRGVVEYLGNAFRVTSGQYLCGDEYDVLGSFEYGTGELDKTNRVSEKIIGNIFTTPELNVELSV